MPRIAEWKVTEELVCAERWEGVGFGGAACRVALFGQLRRSHV